MQQDRRTKRNFILTVLILFGSMMLLGIADSIHGVTLPLMKNEFGATNQTQGILSAAFTLGCVFAGFGCGFLLKKAGIKPTLLISYLMFALPMLLLPVVGVTYLSSAAAFLLMKMAFTVNENAVNGLAAGASETPGRMLSLTHFFFGVGATLGPMIASTVIASWGFSWKQAYLLILILIAVLSILAFFTRTNNNPVSHVSTAEPDKAQQPSILSLIKNPRIILFGITFSFIAQTEYVANTWGAIYLEDSFGLDPAVGGASFLSLFFVFFAASRLVFGLLLDKVGYKRIITFCMVCTILTLSVGFGLGEAGIPVLAFSGFFVAVEWPAMLALMTRSFGRWATVAMTIACTLCNIIVVFLQLINGFMAETFGGSWGYRMCLPYSALSLVFFLILQIHGKRKAEIS